MPDNKILALQITLSVCFFILLLAATTVHGSKQQMPDELACDPDIDEDCDQLQMESNQSSSIAKEDSESDQTKPSDSIKVEGQEIQGEDSGANDKDIPSPPKVNESTYEVKIYPNNIYFYRNFDGAFPPDSQDIMMYMYFNGKGYRLAWYPTNNAAIAPSLPHRTFLVVDCDSPYGVCPTTNQFTVKTSTIPVSIMVFGVEIDDCLRPKFPLDVSKEVLDAHGNKQALLKVQSRLMENIGSSCGSNSDGNDFMGYINEVYLPPTFGSGSHEEEAKTFSILDTTILGDVTNPSYKMSYKIVVNHANPTEVQN